MSLSRPARFPLLRLPFLCIECVIRSWSVFDIIFFALSSQKTRRIVKHLKIPLNGIRTILSGRKCIELGSFSREWHFCNESESESSFKEKHSLVLQTNAVPLYTSRTDVLLESYSKENEVTALILAMKFLTEIFKCSVEAVDIDGDNFPESGDIGVKSTVNLSVDRTYGYAQNQKLNLFLEKLEVTGTCNFWVESTTKDFYVDPKLLKCKQLVFWSGSAAWVTREILLQFEVAQLSFYYRSFTVEDIVSFVTQWFHSDNEKLEYFYIYFQTTHISLENFQKFNPTPFRDRNRIPPSEPHTGFDFSEGLEIVRHDGLGATIHIKGLTFLFYIWHNQ